MTEDPRLSKAVILFQQRNFAEAEKILSRILTDSPTHTSALALLAETHMQQDKFDSANLLIHNAIGLAPDVPHLYYVKAFISFHEDKLDDAERAISRAIELDPYDADYVALFATIRLNRKRFEEALELANRALEIDAENLMALNVRSTALVKLNRSEESFETIEGALGEDPNNAFTHANYGWGLLEKGNHKEALTHFKEALTQDPTLEFAQTGMLEALKASNPVYRLFLKYAFWMGNMTAKYQWGVIIGFYVVFKLLGELADSNKALAPYLTPILILLGVVAFSTWVIDPISNLFLRFNKYGRVLLSKKKRISSNFVALSLGIGLIGLLLYFGLSDSRMLSLVGFGFAMMLPLGTMLSPSKNKHALLIYTIGLACVGILAIGLTFWTGELFNVLTPIFILGFVAYQWIANFTLINEDNL